MICCARVAVLCLGVFAATAGMAGEKFIDVPYSVADKVVGVETTETDMGKPGNLFDLNPSTIIRTPGINPAFVQVEFGEPIEVATVRLRFQAGPYEWSLAGADSVADLAGKRGSYRVLVEKQASEGDVSTVTLAKPTRARVLRLDVLRTSGDGYVHIAEWEFCKPGKVDGLRIQRITDRRTAIEAAKLTAVDEPIVVAEQTVVWLHAEAVAGEATLDVGREVEWEALDDGVAVFGEEPGVFVVKTAGEHKIRARWGETEQVIVVVGTAREMVNREPDVEVLYIERLPRIGYDAGNEGLPEVGSEVVWRGRVYNWGVHDVKVRYTWTLDGAEVGVGEAVIPVGPPATEGTPIDWAWKWDGARHELTLKVEQEGRARDLVPANNTLTIQTDAVTVGLWVERSLWEHHHAYQYWLPTHDANSFAGWGQRMMRQWNKMFAAAVYPEYPQGIVERVRLDEVVVVPDFALPLSGGLPSNNPDLRDKTVDMTWGCEAGDIVPGAVVPDDHWWSPVRALKAFARGDVEAGREDPPFWCGLGYIHEMSHARYLVDGYGFNVHTGTGEDLEQRDLLVSDEEGPILGRYMPATEDLQHWRKYPGQMGGDYWSWSVFEAMCWNRVAGRRGRGGNCNSPPNIGEFLQDIPARLVYEFVDEKGRPLSGAEVQVHRARGTGNGWYTKRYVNEPDLVTQADERGRVTFDRTLFAADGVIRHTYGVSNGVVLVRVTYEGRHYYLFEEVTDPNIAYNLGHHDEYVFKRQITLRDGKPDPKDWDPDARWEPAGSGFGQR